MFPSTLISNTTIYHLRQHLPKIQMHQLRGNTKNLCDIMPENTDLCAQQPVVELEKQTRSYVIEIQNLKETLKNYKNEEIKNASKKRKRDQECEELETQNELLNNEIKLLRDQSTELQSINNQHLLEEMKNMMNNRFNEMENKLTSIVDRKINEKQENTEAAMKNTFADTIRMNLNENTIGKAVREP